MSHELASPFKYIDVAKGPRMEGCACTITARRASITFSAGCRSPPHDNRENNPGHEESAEDVLVVSSDPQRQIDIEVVASVISVARSYIRKWAPQSVGQ